MIVVLVVKAVECCFFPVVQGTVDKVVLHADAGMVQVRVFAVGNLSSKLPTMTEEEQIALLATNGKLVKRPLVVTERFVLVGFKPEEWEKLK